MASESQYQERLGLLSPEVGGRRINARGKVRPWKYRKKDGCRVTPFVDEDQSFSSDAERLVRISPFLQIYYKLPSFIFFFTSLIATFYNVYRTSTKAKNLLTTNVIKRLLVVLALTFLDTKMKRALAVKQIKTGLIPQGRYYCLWKQV